MRKTSDNIRILGRPGQQVKAQIVAAGIKLADLAGASGVKPNTLSDYLGGRLRNVDRQFTIYAAFCRLAGQEASGEGFESFWGRLRGGRVA